MRLARGSLLVELRRPAGHKRQDRPRGAHVLHGSKKALAIAGEDPHRAELGDRLAQLQDAYLSGAEPDEAP